MENQRRIDELNILMNKYQTDSELVETLKEILNYIQKIETLKNNLILENQKIKNISEKEKNRIAYFRHEIINVLGANKGLTQLLNIQYSSLNDDEKKEIIGIILKTSEKANNLSGLLYSKENLNKSKFNLEEIAINDAEIYEKDFLEKEKIGINLRYETKYEKPIEIFSHRCDFEAIFGTLISNSVSWAPKYSRIEEAIRIDKKNNLEILFENKKTEEKIRENGMGKGYGMKIIKEIISELGGEFHTYSKPIIFHNANLNFYNQMKKFGSKKATDQISSEDSVFGVSIKIPMQNLSYQ